MNCQLEDTLRQVAEDTFAALAFVLPLSEEERPAAGGAQQVSVRVAFSGPLTGYFVLTVDQEMLPALAANILGLKAGSSTSPEQQEDALKESLNVICGNALPRIASPKDIFHVHAPHLIEDRETARMMRGPRPQAHVKLWLDCGQADLALFSNQPLPVSAT
jgi:hypothetical protein